MCSLIDTIAAAAAEPGLAGAQPEPKPEPEPATKRAEPKKGKKKK